MILKHSKPSSKEAFTEDELPFLAEEIRQLILKRTSEKGGHVASNLGAVELSIAIHHVFNSPEDKIVYDVSHQTYTHKILTGREDSFIGFSDPEESEHDVFRLGHTSTSIGLACGLAKARNLSGGDNKIIAVIGDASLDGGQSFEGLNECAELEKGIIIIVNDNQMSIPENYGGLHKHLKHLRDTHGQANDNFFRSLGFDYCYVEDGHDIKSLIDVFRKVSGDIGSQSVVVHVCTQKGHGYSPAVQDPEKWHWARPFDIPSGQFLSGVSPLNYGALAGDYLLKKMQRDSKLVVLAASTPICIGFDKKRRAEAGSQFIDVGIAEQNATLMAAGLAKAGMHPVFATNSTFLQRAYDQIENEVCLNNLPVTFIVTHSGIYGHGNDTHSGVYDIPLLSHIPNLTYLAPAHKEEYLSMLEWSISNESHGPVAIRVPWAGVYGSDRTVAEEYGTPAYQITRKGSGIALLALGSFYHLGEAVADKLADHGFQPTLINPIFITGYDTATLNDLRGNHSLIVTLEDGWVEGGFGAHIAKFYGPSGLLVKCFGITQPLPRTFTGTKLAEANGLTADSICDNILHIIHEKNL